ncbi:hypothetical protein [Agrobacterium tumefaciens]|uniref:Uncharacterized protein n=1 Tax=Agrobacterium tumefaciens TaxID=358 RepID=A0AAW8LVT5_AGRTU|nr:hypothetical protein [Agrobacterium tumefaciens]MDR6702999.1 hypothetical protein [Agrobacterium tumefaciens]
MQNELGVSRGAGVAEIERLLERRKLFLTLKDIRLAALHEQEIRRRIANDLSIPRDYPGLEEFRQPA